MKQLLFSYELNIALDAPVLRHYFTLRCLPQSDARQHIGALEYAVTPADCLRQSTDGWGNALIYGRCMGESRDFRVRITGAAQTGLSSWIPGVTPERDRVFAFPTGMTTADTALASCACVLPADRPLDAAQQAMTLIRSRMRYVPGATNVQTTAAQAFRQGQGVCQDFAHVMLALLRQRGIPCRYITGMLPGEGRSHAWVEVLDQGSWYSLDPTNFTTAEDYIKFSHGRDAWDCAINRGIFRGSANQISEESVIVTEREL